MSRRLRAIRAASSKRADRPLEKAIQAQILELLDAWRIAAWPAQTQSMSRRGARAFRSGLPDITGVLPWGQFLAIEVKGGPKDRLSEAQAQWILETARRSPWAIVIIARGVSDVQHPLAPLVTRWREVEGSLRPIERFWASVEGGSVAPDWIRANDAAIAAAEHVLAKERARPRPGVPAPLL